MDGAVDSNVQDGANPSITIGELDMQQTYSGTVTAMIDMIIDDAGAQNGYLTISGGTLDTAGVDVTLDGLLTIDQNGFFLVGIGSTVNMPNNGNLTVTSGAMDSGGIVTSSGYYDFFIDYDAVLWLNNSEVTHADPVISFEYHIGAGTTTTVNELQIAQSAGSDAIVNITQRDFSVKNSGTVLTFQVNSGTGTSSNFYVSNLTTGQWYQIDVDGIELIKVQAVGSQIGWSYSDFSTRTFSVSHTTVGTGEGGPFELSAEIGVSQSSYNIFHFMAEVKATNFITSYHWEFGDGITSTLRNPNHEYRPSFVFWEDYTIKLTIKDDMRHETSATAHLRVINWPVILLVAAIAFGVVAGVIYGVKKRTSRSVRR
ncbi:MAG: hypothetical protein JSW41_05565 [Candidatus Aenigmatarchaeota archaeon]|nr:MAG: hypothetical protein JSW41_05565 [Candidatus Aenigmarchaeota archaeon]